MGRAVGAPATLRTERLLLRQWRPGDLDPFAALNADPVTMEHFPSTLDRVASDALAARIETHIDEHGWGLWATEVVGGDGPPAPFIGFVGLAEPAHMPGAVELGWRLARDHWGRGYAPEAARACLRFAVHELGLAEVVSFTSVGNANSRRVMEKIGMTHRPARDFDHPSIDPVARPDLVRHVLYAVAAHDVAAGGHWPGGMAER
jgi:RimJ/RimL family protein N-acetyltransferase